MIYEIYYKFPHIDREFFLGEFTDKSEIRKICFEHANELIETRRYGSLNIEPKYLRRINPVKPLIMRFDYTVGGPFGDRSIYYIVKERESLEEFRKRYGI